MSAINVNVRVQNNFNITASRIQLWHQFRSNPVQTLVWSNVSPNGGQTSYGQVSGSTGVGHDFWQIQVTLSNDVVWEHTSWKTCTIRSSDGGSYQTQVVSPGYWSIPLNSGGCTTSLTQVGGDAVESEAEPENKKAAGTTQGDPAPA